MPEKSARERKLQKAQGTQIVCPKCSSTGPFNPDFAARPIIFTCLECQTRFDSNNKIVEQTDN